MTGLAETLTTLARYQRDLRAGAGGASEGLTEVAGFGANPGALRMLMALPPGLPRGAGLVVALHGCTQTAAAFDQAAGWSELGARYGFAVLLPEQARQNNAGGCFNWFERGDTTRGSGEAASVAAMIGHAVAAYGLDPRRVFVTGLSAGGAFANVMLATYPELFAGGAIIAGLPYGGAEGVQQAIGMMSRGVTRSDSAWGDAVRGAAPHRGRYPSVSVWHGLADTTVVPANGAAIVRQWLDVQGVRDTVPVRSAVPGGTQDVWHGRDGRVMVTHVTLPGLGHAVPISTTDPVAAQRCGKAGPFAMETGLSSSFLIAQGWGLANQPVATAGPPAPGGVAAIIARALKAAGL